MAPLPPGEKSMPKSTTPHSLPTLCLFFSFRPAHWASRRRPKYETLLRTSPPGDLFFSSFLLLLRPCTHSHPLLRTPSILQSFPSYDPRLFFASSNSFFQSRRGFHNCVIRLYGRGKALQLLEALRPREKKIQAGNDRWGKNRFSQKKKARRKKNGPRKTKPPFPPPLKRRRLRAESSPVCCYKKCGQNGPPGMEFHQHCDVASPPVFRGKEGRCSTTCAMGRRLLRRCALRHFSPTDNIFA